MEIEVLSHVLAEKEAKIGEVLDDLMGGGMLEFLL